VGGLFERRISSVGRHVFGVPGLCLRYPAELFSWRRASRCCRVPARAPGGRGTAKAATASGWPSRGSTCSSIDFSPSAPAQGHGNWRSSAAVAITFRTDRRSRLGLSPRAALRRSSSRSSRSSVHLPSGPMKWAGMRKTLRPGGVADPTGIHAEAAAITALADRKAVEKPLHAANARRGLPRLSRRPTIVEGGARDARGARRHAGMSAVIKP